MKLLLAVFETIVSLKFLFGFIAGGVVGGPAMLKIWQKLVAFAKSKI